jgi:hypothetical protein
VGQVAVFVPPRAGIESPWSQLDEQMPAVGTSTAAQHLAICSHARGELAHARALGRCACGSARTARQ